MTTQLDHLVIMADSLSQGELWCEQTLGIIPSAGGEHERFGTHNRLFKIATPSYPWAYCEIIAIDPERLTLPKGVDRRWFDMDDVQLRAAVKQSPRLIHFVANTSDIQASRAALRTLQIDRGPAIACSRESPKGLVNWQITVRPDGQRLFNGGLPSLIQWGKPKSMDPMSMHPRHALARSGVSLQSLSISHPASAKLKTAFEAMGLNGVTVEDGPANLVAVLNTPKGPVSLESLGI
jgi:hypothetical protein